jgi:hypothetical protein
MNMKFNSLKMFEQYQIISNVINDKNSIFLNKKK